MGELSDWAENDALLGTSCELGIRCRGTFFGRLFSLSDKVDDVFSTRDFLVISLSLFIVTQTHALSLIIR